MASDLSKYLGNKIVRWLAGETFPSAPTDVFIAMFDGDPKSGGTEVTADVNSAGRIAIPVTAPADNSVDNVLASDSDVDFGASESDCDISHLAVFDAQASGNRLGSKALGSPVSPVIGQNVSFLAGDLEFTIGS